MSHMSSKKHSNAAGQSSRGSSSKGRMPLTSYLWKKNWNAMEKLWKSYGISFLGICTNPVEYYFLSSGDRLHCNCFTYHIHAHEIENFKCNRLYGKQSSTYIVEALVVL